MNFSFEAHFQTLPQLNKTQKSRQIKPNQKIRFLRKGHNQNEKRKISNKNETKGFFIKRLCTKIP